MTSHELARLLLFRPDLPVIVNGYEGGWKDLKEDMVGVLNVAPNYWVDEDGKCQYYGPHEDFDQEKLSCRDEDEPKLELVLMMALSRNTLEEQT